MALTIKEVKEKKITLESNIMKLVQDFEDETDTFVSYINFTREPSKNNKRNDIAKSIEVPEPERDGPINNVEASLRFDI